MPALVRVTNRTVRALVGLTLALALACSSPPPPLDPGSVEYQEAISAFFVGLAALDVGDDARAEVRLTRLTELAANEPAGWADLGLLALRRGDLDGASARLERARSLAPEDARVRALLGHLSIAKDQGSVAVERFREALERAPDDPRTRRALADALERAGDAAGAEHVIEQILEHHPANVAAMLEALRLAVARGDASATRAATARLAERAATMAPPIPERVRDLGDTPTAASVLALRNVLLPEPEYRRDLAELTYPTGAVGDPIRTFLWLAPPVSAPAPADESLRFDARPLEGATSATWAGAVILTSDAAVTPIVGGPGTVLVGGSVKLPFPGTPGSNGVLALDVDADFRTDLFFAGSGGIRLERQTASGAFVDATARTGLPADVTRADYAGAWAADVESDGDLDVVLARTVGPPLVLRNDGDGTFATVEPFAGVGDVRELVWSDLDRDGDPDAAFLDANGLLTIFSNERLGAFRQVGAPLGGIAAITASDVDGDGVVDVVALRSDGAVVAQPVASGAAGVELGRLPAPVSSGEARLFAADFDNNGSVDVAATTGRSGLVWLRDTSGLRALDVLPRERVDTVADVDGDGRLDLLGVTSQGAPYVASNGATRGYEWIELRPRARDIAGDRRVNTFGIGGSVEIRAGLLSATAPIDGPSVHFGVGKQRTADVARIMWPNGLVQAEFDVRTDSPVVFDQRLEGSCPWLFAFDGTRMGFVTDLIWRSPLGLRLNAQETGRITQTEDWVKIRGDQLLERDGAYDLRVTAELWETHFFDRLELRAIDHPAGTEVFVDERFAIPPPPLAVVATGPLHSLVAAVDDRGDDALPALGAVDGRYLDTFGRGAYQGVTRDHFVEVSFDDAPASGPLWLVATGWIHPTDSSVNVAIGQRAEPVPRGLSLEVADGAGGWIVVEPSLGFPEGKNKTILVRVDDRFRPGAPRRLRLRTNLEIYWDRIAWAEGRPDAGITTNVRDLVTADLRYRGFSVVRTADASSPELPDYERIAGTAARWNDLEGFYTRFGDVRELVGVADDRYVIMNAGDELELRFASLPPPPAGWVRDFVLVADGWVKDGNFNTTFSKSVLPLPLHDRPDYTTPPGRLEDDPAYRRHPADWSSYHTRYVAPDAVRVALRR